MLSRLDHAGRPLAEADTHDGVDAVTHGNDGIQIVVDEAAGDVPGTLLPNFQGFLGSCLLVQFAARVDVPQVQTDVLGRAGEEFCDLRQGKPCGLAVEASLDAGTLSCLHFILSLRHATAKKMGELEWWWVQGKKGGTCARKPHHHQEGWQGRCHPPASLQLSCRPRRVRMLPPWKWSSL